VRFDVLLVYRVDRLARSIRGLAQIIDELDQAGVIFRSATEPFDTGTPAGRMMVQMLGVFAEFERALIVERITAGLERKAARGGWCGGQRPFGLNIAADRDSLERNPTEAPERATAADLDALRGNLRAALNDSTPRRVKGVLQTMIDGIRVDARDHIEPTFRVPAVRIDYGYMEPIDLKSNRFARLPGGLTSLDDAVRGSSARPRGGIGLSALTYVQVPH
jgi:hypothetical protein